jgi:hypothetical protein
LPQAEVEGRAPWWQAESAQAIQEIAALLELVQRDEALRDVV